ncbi:MAG: DUF3943 domain-containing protein [Sulfuritalea sp.]|nr:DUF3943 domain-containing protein [Sulfuritalea sp.]
MLFSTAVGLVSTAVLAAATPESAAVGVPPGYAAGDNATARDREIPKLIWSPDLQWRKGPSLRIPNAMLAQASEAGTPAAAKPGFAALPEFGSNKSYSIPALEILGFDFLVNRVNKQYGGGTDYDVSLSSIRDNLRSSWVTDNDPYKVNQFAHPYQGSMYHGFARSAGLSYWESAAYTFAGSAAWEIAGEKTRPSKNDQIASGIAGSFLGEALFRISSLVLENGDTPKFWREVAAAVISPSTGFNRLAFGERYDPIFSSRGAAYHSRLQLGTSGTTRNIQGSSTAVKRNELLADFSMEYGLPGKAGYEYTRPFDYFAFQTTASSANVFENVQTRGMLVGKPYGENKDTRGIWGIYGSYDYISPQTYRISSTALSLGTTAQRWLTQDIALQGTALAGAGYAAVGTLHGTTEGEYHYGVAPQALLALRLILGERAALDVTAREYFVKGVGAGNTGGHDNIARADISLTVRVHKQHAIAFKYLWNRRDATYSFLGNGTQERATLGIFYSYIGKDRFGAVDWR